MNRLLIAMLFLITMNIESSAQQMIPGQTGVELSYSVFPNSPEKQNYMLSTGLVSYVKNGDYFFGLAEYSRKYYEYTNYNIPIDTFLLSGGYSFYLWGDLMRDINLNLGIGGLVGYEKVNTGDDLLYDGSIINPIDNFIYGASGKLSLESYLTGHLVFLVNGQLRFLKNSQMAQFHSLFGFGIRCNF
ncbi:conjugal transfer protein TraO [Chryseobacterium sp. CBSDS_008]|uniref:conjugal transfer protein TraO n=1 Tax=Chryseobacterium sp. CBSDS_008 TaxID=3415265 RepID=UPI003CF8449D